MTGPEDVTPAEARVRMAAAANAYHVDPDDAVIAKGLLGIPAGATIMTADMDKVPFYMIVQPDGHASMGGTYPREAVPDLLRKAADAYEAGLTGGAR